MRQDWTPEELIATWTLLEHDWRLVANKRGATRLGFALLVKFFECEARFPQGADELPMAVIGYMAEQVGVPADAMAEYEWSGRTFEYHRAQVRKAFRVPGGDQGRRGQVDRLAGRGSGTC